MERAAATTWGCLFHIDSTGRCFSQWTPIATTGPIHFEKKTWENGLQC